jgi:hypothetical protein
MPLVLGTTQGQARRFGRDNDLRNIRGLVQLPGKVTNMKQNLLPAKPFPAVTMLVVALAAFTGGVVGVNTPLFQDFFGSSKPSPRELQLDAEITLLKRALGELSGTVALLGPEENGAKARGKLVWDTHMQKGFIQVSHLFPIGDDQVFRLWAVDKNGKHTLCEMLRVDSSGRVQQSFGVTKPVFRPEHFEVRLQQASVQTQEGEVILAGTADSN